MNYSVSSYQNNQLFNWSELIKVGHALGHKWWMIGAKLRVPELILDHIAASNSEVGDCGVCLLREWLARDPQWIELITVLETPAVGLVEVAKNVRAILSRDSSKGQTSNKIVARCAPATTSTRNHWEQSLNGKDDCQVELTECCAQCQSLLDSLDSDQWERGIEESSRGIDMCRDSNLSISNSNEVAMVLHLMRAKLMWKLVMMKQSKEVSKWHQLEKCLLDCEEVIRMARCSPKYGNTEYEGMTLAYQCGLVKGDDRVIEQYRRNLLQRGTTRATMLQLERAAFEGSNSRSYKTHAYHLQEMLFPKVSFIEQPLLEDVIQCYKDRQTVCRNCFYNDLKLSRGFNAKGQCTRCQWEFKKLLVIPKSPMTVNYYKCDMIAIPPWPKSKPNDLPFESCAKPTDKSQEHKRCLVMSRNSAVWYAHTVEELVIWTVEREYGCPFEEFIQQRATPLTPFMSPMAPPHMPPQMMQPLPPSLVSTNHRAPQQPHTTPVGNKQAISSDLVPPQHHLGSSATRGSSWSPWSNDLDFLSPSTTANNTSNSSLMQIWSKPGHTSLDVLQSSFNDMSLGLPTSRSRDAWDFPLAPPSNTKWSEDWSSNLSEDLSGYSIASEGSRYSRPYHGPSNHLSRSVPSNDNVLSRGVDLDYSALSRPRSVLYHPLRVAFSSVASIPKELLKSVCQCFSQRQRVCPTCFVSSCQINQSELFNISRRNGPCHSCGQSLSPIVVMPSSPLCVNIAAFILILSCPANLSCIKCCPIVSCHDQQCCLAHSVEELVIWFIEFESGRPFESVFEYYLTDNYHSKAVGAPAAKRYTLASVTFKNRNNIPKELLLQVLNCFSMRQTVCKACFYKFRPQTEAHLESLQPVQIGDQLVCNNCNQHFSGQLVIPSSPLCDNSYGSYLPIAKKGQNVPVQSVEELVLKLMDGKTSVDPFNNV